MGHDIYGARSEGALETAYIAGRTDQTRYPFNRPGEFPYLRYSMGNHRSHEVYEALGCTDLDGGVSGIGEGRTFTVNEIVRARNTLAETAKDWPDWVQEQEKAFFETLLVYAEETGTAYISFG